MAGVQYGINSGVGWCVVGGLGIGFDVDADWITLGIDKGIYLGFLDISFEGYNDGKLEVLVIGVQDGINSAIGRCDSEGFGIDFDGYSDWVTLGIEDVIDLGVSDRYCEVCSDGKLEFLVTWVRDGINTGIFLCIVGGLCTGVYGD